MQIATVRSDLAREYFGTPGVEERYKREIPMRRIGEPSDMADAVKWLANAPYITGSLLQVSGGQQLCRYPFMNELPSAEETYRDYGALADRVAG